MATFEGSYLGDAVYDPAAGDEVWQIPPGTPFTALPAHWACPNCAGAKEQFMVVTDA